MHNQKIPLSGKLAYENQLLKHHARETRRFLVNEREYTGTEIETIMRFYKKKITVENITKVHTHPTMVFLTALCTGKLETLYTNTTCKH